MERRKYGGGSNLDELAIVKAAAWAWYEHGSGAERKPKREYELARTQKPPRPSRYKLEAMKEDHIQDQENPKLYSPLLSNPVSGNSAGENSDLSLLDTYEIERISRHLNYYIESSRAKHLKSFLGGANGSDKRSKPKNNNSKGFWLVVCGWKHDVVETTVEVRRRGTFGDSRQPEKNVAVVKGASRSPRGVHA